MNKIEIIYATLENQKSHFVLFEDKTTVQEALEQSKILDIYGISIDSVKFGVYSRIVELDTELQNNDRLEIYRNLKIDPKQARIKRAEEKRKRDGNIFGS